MPLLHAFIFCINFIIVSRDHRICPWFVYSSNYYETIVIRKGENVEVRNMWMGLNWTHPQFIPCLKLVHPQYSPLRYQVLALEILEIKICNEKLKINENYNKIKNIITADYVWNLI